MCMSVALLPYCAHVHVACIYLYCVNIRKHVILYVRPVKELRKDLEVEQKREWALLEARLNEKMKRKLKVSTGNIPFH